MKSSQRDNPITRSKLTTKQANFVKEYVKNGGNGTQAVLNSYNTDDYNSAHSIACENLQKLTIVEQIHEAAARINLTPQKVLGRLSHVLEQDQRTVAAAQVINDMCGWKAPTKIDNVHRLGAPEDEILGHFS